MIKNIKPTEIILFSSEHLYLNEIINKEIRFIETFNMGKFPKNKEKIVSVGYVKYSRQYKLLFLLLSE